MARRKIIFFAIVTFIVVALVFGIISVINMQKKNTISPEDLNIWITEGTSKNYEPLIEGFKQQFPEYKNINIKFEKKAAWDPDRYRTFILSVLSDKTSPDIFMIPAGEDAILENKIALLTEENIDINAFENSFDTVFRWLVVSSGSLVNPTKNLKWVPIGYETLGVFYNSALLRSGVPSTWIQVQNLYGKFPVDTFPTNLWLGPKFTPNAANVLTAFLVQDNIKSYKEAADGGRAIDNYASYAKLQWSSQDQSDWGEDFYNTQTNLENTTSMLAKEKLTTFDQFLQGKIGMIIWYPSLITELEKSAKRVGWSTSANIIQTAPLPSQSTRNITNNAKYSYFAIARTTNKPNISLAFLQYLMSEDAQRILLREFPYLLPAHKKFLETKKWTWLSSILKNAKIDGFIPRPSENLVLFDYWVKSEFDAIIENGFASNNESDINEIPDKITQKISCTINVQINQSDAKCE